MDQPKPESRITNLENRTTTIEAQLIELASDTAEELKAIRNEIKQGHVQIGEAIDSNTQAVMQEIQAIKTTMATKEDLSNMATKDDISRIESRQDTMDSKLEQILKLLQQRPNE